MNRTRSLAAGPAPTAISWTSVKEAPLSAENGPSARPTSQLLPTILRVSDQHALVVPVDGAAVEQPSGDAAERDPS